ncbi:uncharacterized protein LOC135368912 [Ornithodoros turicata]|uniref:uncharacterized protein LOC135368912 n=1 Tax=Ornithodoros turicata TaxID=34597 RepID=UPI00313A453B
MSYEVSSVSEFTYQQMHLIAQARGTEGVHVIYQNGFKNEPRKDERVMYPSGPSVDVRMVHVLHYTIDRSGQKFRIERPDKTEFLEYAANITEKISTRLPAERKLTFSGTSRNDRTKTFTHVSNTRILPGLHVLQLDIYASGKLMVQLDGNDCFSQPMGTSKFTVAELKEFRYHGFELNMPRPSTTLMEVHVIKAEQSKASVFNHGQQFTTPTIGLSPGAYIMWDGKVETDDAVTIKDGTTQLFQHQGKTISLRVVMKVGHGRILIGEDGKPPNKHQMDTYNVTTAPMKISNIEVSEPFKLKNCVVQSGVLGRPW